MNTFGLKKNGINTFGLGLRIGAIAKEGWREIANFALYIKHVIKYKFER
jgi:hypothetical protein